MCSQVCDSRDKKYIYLCVYIYISIFILPTLTFVEQIDVQITPCKSSLRVCGRSYWDYSDGYYQQICFTWATQSLYSLTAQKVFFSVLGGMLGLAISCISSGPSDLNLNVASKIYKHLLIQSSIYFYLRCEARAGLVVAYSVLPSFRPSVRPKQFDANTLACLFLFRLT